MCLEAFHARPLHHQFGISKKLAGKLNLIGITTMHELIEIGSVQAYKRLQKAGKAPYISALYAFEGAIIGEHWYCFSAEQKAEIRSRLTD